MKFLLLVNLSVVLATMLRPGDPVRGERYSEEPRIIGTDSLLSSERAIKRAEAAATLRAERDDPSLQFYPVASQPDQEQFPDWQVFQVMLQAGPRFRVLKVCLPADESVSPVVLEQGEPCEVQTDSRTDDQSQQLQRAAATASELATQLQRLAQSLRPKPPRSLTWAD